MTLLISVLRILVGKGPEPYKVLRLKGKTPLFLTHMSPQRAI